MRCGTPARKCGGKGERDNGNGALMRILPLAFTDCRYQMGKRGERTDPCTREISLEACRIYISVARNRCGANRCGQNFKND